MLRLSTKPLTKFPVGARSLYTPILDSDINITKNGKTNIQIGAGGRSSRTGYTATVFGASGFLGRYLTSKLARHGTITVVPFRDEMKSRFLKVSGDLGVVNYVEFDIRNIKSIEDSVKHSDIVYNCIGADYDTKNFSMADVNIEGARRIATAVKEAGVPRYVHVSSYNADVNSKSVFYATKGVGEEVTREIIPDATIVRPSPIYGRESQLISRLGNPKNYLLVNNHQETIYPTHVLDVAKALEIIGFNDAHAGKTFELYGNEKYSMDEIRRLIEPIIKTPFQNYNMNKELALFISKVFQLAWWPLTNPDQIERQTIDHVIDHNLPNYGDLGIEPDKLTNFIFTYTKHMRNYLTAHNLAPTPKELRELKQYIHIVD